MPTPLGHALAGVAIAWSAQSARPKLLTGGTARGLTIACAGLAVAPDLDLLYPPIHRMVSHSVTAVAAVAAISWLVARRANIQAAGSAAAVCGLAYGSHLLLDWLGGDTKLPEGIRLLWPFTDAWFISSWSLFRATILGGFFTPRVMMANALAVLQELVILTPFAAAAWFLRGRTPGALAKPAARRSSLAS